MSSSLAGTTAPTLPREIPPGLLKRSVEGVNLDGASLGDLVEGGPHALVFLRHFG